MRVHPIRIPAELSVALMIVAAGLVVPNPAAASELAWIRSGPEGGEVSALAVHPTDPSVVFAGTNDGVYRSDDGGQTWSRKSTGIGSRYVTTIVVNPQRTDEVFALAWGHGGLFKSVDGGESWESLPLGVGRSLYFLRFSLTPFALYVVDEPFLFSSTDSGKTWGAVSIDLGTIPDFAVHPTSPGRMAAALYHDGIAVSSDFGKSWTTCGSVPDTIVWRVTLDPFDVDVLYFPGSNVIFRSFDGCRTWGALPAPGTERSSFLIADTGRPNTVYVDTEDGLIVSSDRGQNWSRFGPTLEPLRSYDMAFGFGGSNRVYLAAEALGDQRGVFNSDDGSSDWTIGNRGLFASSAVSIVPDPTDSTIAYAGATLHGFDQGYGVFKSWDSGHTWALLGGTEGAGPLVAVDPLAPDTVYTTTANWGILKSTDAGQTWFEVWEGISGRRISGVEVDQHHSGTLYLVIEESDRDAYRSDDGGTTWVKLSLPDDDWVFGIYSDPHSPGVVYATTTYRLFRSSDFGESWVLISDGLDTPPNCWEWGCADYHHVTDLSFDPTDSQTMYASTHVGPFRTNNGGLTWEPARNGITICCPPAWSDECDESTKSIDLGCEGWPEGLAVDPSRPSTVYTTTSLGTYRSYNRGERWDLIVGPNQTNPEAIIAMGDGLVLGASNRAGVLRLRASPVPPPRRPGHRILPGDSSTTKANEAQHHQ